RRLPELSPAGASREGKDRNRRRRRRYALNCRKITACIHDAGLCDGRAPQCTDIGIVQDEIVTGAVKDFRETLTAYDLLGGNQSGSRFDERRLAIAGMDVKRPLQPIGPFCCEGDDV
ncbi:MAG: hypothetical protein AB7P12_14935, partial [Alphaproteobacteria bacterium]